MLIVFLIPERRNTHDPFSVDFENIDKQSKFSKHCRKERKEASCPEEEFILQFLLSQVRLSRPRLDPTTSHHSHRKLTNTNLPNLPHPVTLPTIESRPKRNSGRVIHDWINKFAHGTVVVPTGRTPTTRDGTGRDGMKHVYCDMYNTAHARKSKS
jgi:hypothetical protein